MGTVSKVVPLLDTAVFLLIIPSKIPNSRPIADTVVAQEQDIHSSQDTGHVHLWL